MIILLSWLIANLEILFFLFLSIITIQKININSELGLSLVIAVIGYTILPILGIISSAKSFFGSLFIAFISAFVHWYLYIEDNSMFWIVFTPTLIVSIAIGVFTAIFKDAVISCRMLYVNSGVDMFEFSLLYVLNRFFSTFSCMTVALLFSTYFDKIVNFFIDCIEPV